MGLDVYTSAGARLTSPQLPTYVTSLPSGPIDGQEVYYAADATNGVIWHLRYRSGSSSSYKWEFVGGPPMSAEVAGSATRNNAASYAAPDTGTAGPSLTVPLAGNYMISLGMEAYSLTALGQIFMSYDIGATGAVDADSIQFQQPTGQNSARASVAVHRPRTFSSANTTLTVKYKAGSGTATFQQRVISLLPVRVG